MKRMSKSTSLHWFGLIFKVLGAESWWHVNTIIVLIFLDFFFFSSLPYCRVHKRNANQTSSLDQRKFITIIMNLYTPDHFARCNINQFVIFNLICIIYAGSKSIINVRHSYFTESNMYCFHFHISKKYNWIELDPNKANTLFWGFLVWFFLFTFWFRLQFAWCNS